MRELLMLCPPGFEELVSDSVSREFPTYVPLGAARGVLRGKTDADVERLRAFPCASNVFVVIAEAPRSTLVQEAGALGAALAHGPQCSELTRVGPIQLRISDDGKFAPTASRVFGLLEDALASMRRPQITIGDGTGELWMIRRPDLNKSVLALKVSTARPRPPRGELRPEICAALARVEPLDGAQLVLDPFAGSGAIGDACLAAGAKRVWLNDLDPPRDKRPHGSRIQWTHGDFRKVRVATQSVDAIVTDPPWGRNWSVKHGVTKLYGDLGAAAKQWLRPGGALVVLTGVADGALRAMLDAGNLRGEVAVPVLINGSRARIIRARKGRRTRRR